MPGWPSQMVYRLTPGPSKNTFFLQWLSCWIGRICVHSPKTVFVANLLADSESSYHIKSGLTYLVIWVGLGRDVADFPDFLSGIIRNGFLRPWDYYLGVWLPGLTCTLISVHWSVGRFKPRLTLHATCHNVFGTTWGLLADHHSLTCGLEDLCLSEGLHLLLFSSRYVPPLPYPPDMHFNITCSLEDY